MTRTTKQLGGESPRDRASRDRASRDRQRFEETALPHLDAVYRFARHLAGSEPEAQDLTQECFHLAFRKFDQFQEGTNCRAWLFRITKNAFIDRLRRAARQPRPAEIDANATRAPDEPKEALLSWEQLAETTDELFEAPHFTDEVARALGELSEEFRTAVLLCDVEELSYEEISQVLDCPIGTVRSRISRGRQLLKDKLASYARGLGFATGDS